MTTLTKITEDKIVDGDHVYNVTYSDDTQKWIRKQ